MYEMLCYLNCKKLLLYLGQNNKNGLGVFQEIIVFKILFTMLHYNSAHTGNLFHNRLQIVFCTLIQLIFALVKISLTTKVWG